MKSTYRERLDLLSKAPAVCSTVALVDDQYAASTDTVIGVLVNALVDLHSTEVVVVVDESESMRVPASVPAIHSSKLQVGRLVADIANFLCFRKLSKCKVLRLGSSGPYATRRSTKPDSNASKGHFARTIKSEKTAYLLRRTLVRMASDAHLIVISDFRSHMWRRNLDALISAGPRVTLVHLVDVADCDFALSGADQLEFAIQPDPSPWNTPLVDSVLPPSDIHAYLGAFTEMNDIGLLGVVVQDGTVDEIMSRFESVISHA